MRRLALLGVWTIASSTAHADGSEDLVVKGQDLAKRGDWSQAINAFKQADAQPPRAENACFIGLAYLRRELWAQSEPGPGVRPPRSRSIRSATASFSMVVWAPTVRMVAPEPTSSS